MKKLIFLFIISILLLSSAAASDNPAALLDDLGYFHSENYTKKTFTIPIEFDLVYNNYNEIQIEAGYNLLPYRGMECIMYTYEIFNHPFGKCHANIIMYKGEIVGGDISSVSISGFMTGLI